MHIKPFVSVNFCYKCGCPVPKAGLTIRTKAGNFLIENSNELYDEFT